MTMRRLPLLLTLFAAITVIFLHQADGGERCTEYGIGIYDPIGSQSGDINVVIYSQPDLTSDTVAVWRSTYIYVRQSDTSFWFGEVMAEYAYETVGFPILEISPDSNWIRVAFNCHDSIGSSDGWILRRRSREIFELWADIIPRQGAVYFIDDEDVRFYDSPESDSALTEALRIEYGYRSDGTRTLEWNYIIYPQSVQGKWMEVIVETPSAYCLSPKEFKLYYGIDEPKRFHAWIRYLDDTGRPLVYYFPRGC
ncbi:MAG: hypothetical protein AB1690_09305 [Candidatus Zixiibacteriota bacterium]